MEATTCRLTLPDSVDPVCVTGPSDALLRRIEEGFDAMVTLRGRQVQVTGSAEEVEAVVSVITRLVAVAQAGEVPTTEDVELAIDQAARGSLGSEAPSGGVVVGRGRRAIRPRTEGQRRYVEAIGSHTITFGLGPAGTGKTYLAMAMAVSALERREVARVVLTRPVVEAGESLGFLPGTLQEKLDPYLRPLMDALFDMCERERALAMLDDGRIEIAPLAFMRGRTFNDAFVILDEAQNTTPAQMKMFLTRLGFSSRFVVTGDTSQRDLPGAGGVESARAALADVSDIAFCDLGRDDIVRHTLVARIVDAYARAEEAREGAADGTRA